MALANGISPVVLLVAALFVVAVAAFLAVRSHRRRALAHVARERVESRFISPAAAPVPASLPEPAPPRGLREGRILLVDDEPSVLELLGESLRERGLGVEQFSDPRGALAAFRQDPSRFSLVIVDFNMPALDGRDVIREIGTVDARVPVLLMTGQEDVQVKDLASGRRLRLLLKPFRSDGLFRAVEGVFAPEARI
jgi:CheY-like chemotaxis protein